MNEVVGVDDAVCVELTALVAGAKRRQRLLGTHADRHVEFPGQRAVDLEVRVDELERAHVRVQMCDVDARVERLADLRARLDAACSGVAFL